MKLNSGSAAVLFPLRLQPELDQATTGAEPVAQRETTAPPSYGIDSLMQFHFFRYPCCRLVGRAEIIPEQPERGNSEGAGCVWRPLVLCQPATSKCMRSC